MPPAPHEVPRGLRALVRAHARELGLLFVAALVLRLVALELLLDPAEIARQDTWHFGYESACIAESVAQGRGYAGPWHRDEPPWSEARPPTGWLTPVYPALLGGAMRLGGGVSAASARWILGLQCLASAATCALLWCLGRALAGPLVARLAGWSCALAPSAIWSASHVIWDTTLVAAAVVLLALGFVLHGPRAGARAALGLGVACGGLLLLNPAPASILPALCWFVAREQAWRVRLARVALCAAAAFVVVLPWLVRNQLQLGSPALRTNLGVELHVGNHPGADGYFGVGEHPSYSAAEFRRYLELGEVAYAAECRGRALAWVREHPGDFAALTLRRVQLFWFGDLPWLDPRREGERSAASDPRSWIKWLQHAGVGLLGLAGLVLLARRNAGARPLLAAVLCFPLPYFVTHVMERYRFPIEPLLLLGLAALLAGLIEWRTSRRAPR